jgi:AcrR family transcriptional regulator
MEPETNCTGCAHKAGRPRDEGVRQKILDAALELLEEGGYSKVTCDGIAQRAGCGKATIYRWWPNKAAVVINAFVERVTPDLPNEKQSCLRDYVTGHMVRFAKVIGGRNGRILAAVIAAAQEDAEVAEAMLSHWLRPRRAVSRQILAEYQREGQLPAEYDLEIVLDAMYGPSHMRLLIRHGTLTPEYAEGLAKVLLGGLLTDEHRPAASRTAGAGLAQG